MMRKAVVMIALALALLSGLCAWAEETDGDCVYALMDEQGRELTRRGGRIYEGDEYIAGDDGWYRVVAVDDNACTATAQYLGQAQMDGEALSAFFSLAPAQAEDGDGRKLIAMYSTHSDESYVPSDGASSKWEGAGIYDVGEGLKEALEKQGIDVVYSRETFLPHDADAYSRSRRVAEELMKQRPDALLDIHRDAIPAELYETKVDGEDMSMVRLFVGRTNQNASENKAFAQRLKAAADEAYPGLVKDIFIGRGNYNQDLYPHAILLEFGSHETDKDEAIESTGYMASVLSSVLYDGDGGAKATDDKSVLSSIGWLILVGAVGAVLYALISTGTLKSAWEKLRRNASEMSGGLFGDRHRK